jgi:gluconate 5-dehydrogenase
MRIDMQHALSDLFSLEGCVALVTGASSGIGRAIAQGLVRAGAAVAFNGRAVDRLAAAVQEAGGAAEAFPADVSDLDALEPLVAAVAARFGRLDVLVNCAGMNIRRPIDEVTPAIYDQIMTTNLRGVYFLSQAARRQMASQGGGKIIHIGSLTTSLGIPDISVYGMTKSALGQLAKTMAVEWAPDNIQVNCICPGFIKTELTGPLWADPNRSAWIMSRLPAKRPGQPADLVGAAIFLASPASNYITGQSLYVDGGFTAGSDWNKP